MKGRGRGRGECIGFMEKGKKKEIQDACAVGEKIGEVWGLGTLWGGN